MEFSQPDTTSMETVEQLRDEIGPLFDVIDTTLDHPEPGHFRFRGQPTYGADDPTGFDRLRAIFERYGYTPFLRREQGRIALYGYPFVVAEPPVRWGLNLLLFVATIFSTLFAGVLGEPAVGALVSSAAEPAEQTRILLMNLWRGWPFCVSILLILGAHELGHYFAARYHRVPASLPYFIPFPFSIIGTMGAFILQRGPSKNVRVQFDIGAAGPLAGLVFAVPILILGLTTSTVGPLPAGPYILEGNSIFYATLKTVLFGEFLPSATRDVSLNQVAWAGWVGLLVTALNLSPVGQFDGGRVAQVLVGTRVLKQLFWPILLAMIALGFLAATPTWFVWAALLFFFGNRQEQPLDEITTLDPTRRALAIFTMVLFFLLFVPIPLQQIG